MQTVERIVEVLEEAGIDHLFGIPGGDTGRIYKALYHKQDKIKVVVARDEQTAACMADMYGRLTGKPGVFMAQGCYAASTGLFGVIEAGLGSSPMVVITDITTYGVPSGHGSLQCGGGEYGNFDIAAIFKATCKFTAVAHSPGEGVQAVQRAIKHAVTGRPGPTAAILAIDALRGEISEETFPRIYDTRGYMQNAVSVPHPSDTERAAEMLLSAKRPVIVAGNGVHASKAYAELQALAEAVGAPVATSTLGKSVFPEIHPLALGVMGIFGSPVANKVVSEADLIMIVGCRLKGPDTITESPNLIDPSRQTLIQLDIEPRNAGWVFPINLGLIGDASAALTQLNEALADEAKKRPPYEQQSRFADLQRDKQELLYFADDYSASNAVPILPQRLAKELSDSLAPDAIVCADAGNNRVWMLRYFQTKQAGTYFGTYGIAGMSWSLPAALTAKLLYPDRQCVSVSSDGFAMQNHVLSTALQYDAPVTYVVLNDAQLGMVRQGQGDQPIASEFTRTDWAAVARGYGCVGLQVKNPDEVKPAVLEALSGRKPAVVDVTIDPKEPMQERLRSSLGVYGSY
ncbi:MAG: thiamine pyrophosphate-binding protein [bacterium]|nr:thiamine pyrophosphate-binding protein [bacterium]